MEAQLESAERPDKETGTMSARRRLAWVVGVGLLTNLLLPFIPIVLGVFILMIVGVHLFLPELRPYLEPFVRVPIAGRGERHRRLGILVGLGIFLILLGSVTASLRGSWRGTLEQHERHREAIENRGATLIAQAEACLSARDVNGAELALLDASAVVGLSTQRKTQIDELLDRIRRSGDSEVIRAIVEQLPPEELKALENATSVPKALDFGEDILTYRAVKRAVFLLEESRQTPARR